jgi:hypothetical protein
MKALHIRTDRETIHASNIDAEAQIPVQSAANRLVPSAGAGNADNCSAWA